MAHERWKATALLFSGERGVDFGSVESDDDSAVDIYDWYAHLARLTDGFFGVFGVLFDVVLGVFDAKFVEILFGGMTKRTPGG